MQRAGGRAWAPTGQEGVCPRGSAGSEALRAGHRDTPGRWGVSGSPHAVGGVIQHRVEAEGVQPWVHSGETPCLLRHPGQPWPLWPSGPQRWLWEGGGVAPGRAGSDLHSVLFQVELGRQAQAVLVARVLVLQEGFFERLQLLFAVHRALAPLSLWGR